MPFTIYTDHQPLVHAFTKQGDAWSPRQQRHLSAIAEFTCSKYLPGRKNPVADALSRVELNVVQLGIDYKDLAREQAADPETPAYHTAITSLKWRDVPLAPGGPNLLCVVSPASYKVGQHTESGVGEFPQPGRRFGHVHIDVIGPLPPSGGGRYLLTVVDRSTRWPESTPMQEATTSACAEPLLSSWISCFGIPDHITNCGPPWPSCWGQLITLPRSTTQLPTAWSSVFTGP
ncbi:uncharacterized protein [Macrobrachium rosenbergii]|uniref:uncharacterized protein n=1 Tax=Macrobrachium rosenbergii TaxID=79674 RepID=UPI0034D48F68